MPDSSPATLTAREYLKAFGGIPSVLPRTIRAIRNAASLFSRAPNDSLHEVLAEITELLLRAPTNAAVITAAVAEMHSVHFEDNPDLPPHELIRFLGPDETIAVLSLSFLNRRLGQSCDPEAWSILSQRMRQQLGIGKLLGERVAAIGGGRGLLLTGLPFMALGAMLATDQGAFARYKPGRQQKLCPFDSAEELSLFGTSRWHVAAQLNRALGCSHFLTVAFMQQTHLQPSGAEETAHFHFIKLCEQLHLTGDPQHPKVRAAAAMFGPALLANITRPLEELLNNRNLNEWLYASAQDAEFG